MAGAQVQLVKGEFSFKDGLLYKQEDWTYCTPQDRRFYTEVVDSGPGIKPAGECQLTNDEKAPEIPAGCYDAGDGYFDPERRAVFAYGSTDKQVRRPTEGDRVGPTLRSRHARRVKQCVEGVQRSMCRPACGDAHTLAR